MNYSSEVHQRAHQLDPVAWALIGDCPPPVERYIQRRRKNSLALAYAEIAEQRVVSFGATTYGESNMAMSRDRIEFVLTNGYSHATNERQAVDRDRYVKAASRAFGISLSKARDLFDRAAVIRCRPSQFGRFIVFRVEEGVTCNRIGTLNPKLIPACQSEEIVDLSKNEHAI